MPRSAFIDHIGIAVPDLAAAKRYYDELAQLIGLRAWFETGPEGPLNYGPDGARGTQLFFYQAREADRYDRQRAGLQHIAFSVERRAIVREVHAWALARGDEILHAPQDFLEYGAAHYATYWLDLHGFKLEVVCFNAEEAGAPTCSA